MRRRAPGFTLVELLLVVALIAVLAAVVAPSFSGTGATRRLDDAARSVVALASAARARSSAEGRAYVLIADQTARHVRLARARDPLLAPASEADAELDGDEWVEGAPWASALELVEGLELVDLPEKTTAIRVTFSPDGTAEAATLTLEAQGGERRIVTISAGNGRAVVSE